MTNVKLTFEELATVLIQIEACLNTRPLASIPCGEDGIDALKPGYFLIGCPLEALPDPSSYQKLSFESLASVSSPGATLLAEVVLRVSHYSTEIC